MWRGISIYPDMTLYKASLLYPEVDTVPGNWELGRKKSGNWENRGKNLGIWELNFSGNWEIKLPKLGIWEFKLLKLGIWELIFSGNWEIHLFLGISYQIGKKCNFYRQTPKNFRRFAPGH